MDANVSSRINLMRIVLISGIVFVHVPYNPATSPFLGLNGFADWLRVFLGDSLFRIGVPCLSAISGYLLFRKGLADFHYGRTLKTKALTILLPFLLWNGAFLALVYLAQTAGVGLGYLPDVAGATPREMLSLALAAESWPINLPLYFLRDLLLCLVLSPAIAAVVWRYPRASLAMMLAYAVLPVPNLIFLKKSILFGFGFGACVALHRMDVRKLDDRAVSIVLVVLAMSVLLASGLYALGPDYPLWFDSLRSLAAVAGIFGAWALSALLIRTRAGERLSRTAGLSFWIFCGHYPLLIAFWMVFNRVGAVEDYTLFYFAAPPLVLFLLVATNAAVRHVWPGLHAVLTGSRGGLAPKPGVEAGGRTRPTHQNSPYVSQQR
ncbi:acyltransferase [Rhizobium sp. TRM95111]|nr:acyltransferase [Rhizobium alarense]